MNSIKDIVFETHKRVVSDEKINNVVKTMNIY